MNLCRKSALTININIARQVICLISYPVEGIFTEEATLSFWTILPSVLFDLKYYHLKMVNSSATPHLLSDRSEPLVKVISMIEPILV